MASLNSTEANIKNKEIMHRNSWTQIWSKKSVKNTLPGNCLIWNVFERLILTAYIWLGRSVVGGHSEILVEKMRPPIVIPCQGKRRCGQWVTQTLPQAKIYSSRFCNPAGHWALKAEKLAHAKIPLLILFITTNTLCNSFLNTCSLVWKTFFHW